MQSSSSLYLSRLDHLRFVAAVLVLFWHSTHAFIPLSHVPVYWPASLLEEGHSGVSLFMVLSGFIFFSLCRGKEILYGEFLRNRALRIVPLFVLWLLLLLYTLGDKWTANVFHALLMLGHPATMPEVGWTIIVEVQFYLIFPFLLVFFHRRGLSALVGLIGVALAFRWCLWITHGSIRGLSYWTLFGRIDQFLLGMVVCELTHRFPRLFRSPALLVALVAGWVGLVHGFNSLGGYIDFPAHSIWVYLPTVEGALYAALAACWLSCPVRLPRWFDDGLAWLGKLSFSFYLNHMLVIAVAKKYAAKWKWSITTFNESMLFTVALVLPLLIALSALTYYFVELPFLSLRRPYLVTPAEPAAEAPAEEPRRQAGPEGMRAA